jgi:hypothetical protein
MASKSHLVFHDFNGSGFDPWRGLSKRRTLGRVFRICLVGISPGGADWSNVSMMALPTDRPRSAALYLCTVIMTL